MAQYQHLISQIYQEFNARHIDQVLSLMHSDVQWPNGWEGGYVNGHEAVRAYWSRQWQEIDPVVTPVAVSETPDGRIAVEVHQFIKDKTGTVLFDGPIRHIYTITDGKIERMDIETV